MSSVVMSLARAQREIGWGSAQGHGGRRLRRYLLRREASVGRSIMIRLDGEKGPLRVTMSSLKRYCPELFGAGNGVDLGAKFREYLRGIDERISEKVAEHVAIHVEPRLDELWQRDEQIMGNVTELANRVAALSGAKE